MGCGVVLGMVVVVVCRCGWMRVWVRNDFMMSCAGVKVGVIVLAWSESMGEYVVQSCAVAVRGLRVPLVCHRHSMKACDRMMSVLQRAMACRACFCRYVAS